MSRKEHLNYCLDKLDISGTIFKILNESAGERNDTKKEIVEPECELCHDSGWIKDPSRNAVVLCGCQRRKRLNQLLCSLGISRSHSHCTLEGYKPMHSSYIPFAKKSFESQLAAKNISEKYIQVFPEIKGLLFMGPSGVGKTHLAVSILKAIVELKGVSGFFCHFPELLLKLKKSWNDSSVAEKSILDPVLNSEIVVIDEIDGVKISDWSLETTDYVINNRYNHDKPTIFTATYSDIPVRGKSSLTDQIGYRSRSRLSDMCLDVPMFGDDYRGNSNFVLNF